MSVSPALSYYTDAGDRRRLPTSLLVAAILGNVLSHGVLLLTGLSGAGAMLRPTLGVRNYRFGMPVPAEPSSAYVVGVGLGWLLRSAALVLMAVACFGVLGRRAAARVLMIVCAYAWIVLGAVELFVLLYSAAGTRTLGPPGPVGPGGVAVNASRPVSDLAVYVALGLAVNFAFPIFALVALRRGGVAGAFAREPAGGESVRPLRATAVLVLVFAGMFALGHAAELVAVSSSSAGSDERWFFTSQSVLPFMEPGTTRGAVPNALLGLALCAAFIAGAAMALAGRVRGGRAVLLVATLVKLVSLAAVMTARERFLPLIRGVPMTAAVTFHAYVTTVALWAWYATAPVALLILLTSRPSPPGRVGPAKMVQAL
jgi:hypothetical protein